MDDVATPVMFLPSRTTFQAPALWVTAQNWANGFRDRWGRVVVCLPGENVTSPDLLRAADVAKEAPGRRSGRGLAVRAGGAAVAAKDLRLIVRRLRDGSAYDVPGSVTPLLVWQHHDLLLRSGTAYARQHGVPVISFVDALQVWEARRWGVRRRGYAGPLERWAERPQLLAADVVACVSEEVAASVVDLGVPPRRVVVTPCTADPVAFHPDVDGSATRLRLGLQPDHVVFGWAGSFRRFHGLQQAVDAFVLVSRQLPQARLLLVGDGSERPATQAAIAAAGLERSVVFAGTVPHDEMPRYVAAMDVALLTANEGMAFHYSPLKLREYRSSGRPIVAPRVGQIDTALEDGRDALMYPVGDVRAMAGAMLELGASRDLRAELGRGGRAAELAEGGISAQLDLVLGVLGR